MTYLGTVRHGAVVLEKPAPLADGTKVRVTLTPVKKRAKRADAQVERLWQGLLELAGTAPESERVLALSQCGTTSARARVPSRSKSSRK
jgi:hypothetical protein